MSGIVGIVNLDGAPADRQCLRQMTEFLTYRGPDAQDIWIDGPVGFGHTMLRTTEESLQERQPRSLDRQVWITADARVDGRADLIDKLALHGRTCLEAASDAELILHAYHVWGEDCVQHLLGDFAFAIWDGRHRRLFCARDHFGVKPFYYAHIASSLVFSNTLNCIRLHPAVSDKLNDLAIADFLLFGLNQEPSTTTFADIQRIPPAHSLTWSEGALRLIRYWTLPADGQIQYRQSTDYVDHFKQLLRTAVGDRLRTNRVGIYMSGGLDSTAVAATAHELLSRQGAPFDLRAYTAVYDRLMPDEERLYAGLAAEALGIPIQYLVADDYALYERWDEPELRTPEPTYNPLAAIVVDQLRQVAARSRIALTGYGGDNGFYFQAYFYTTALLKSLRLGRLMADVGRCVLSRGRIPPLGFRTALKRMRRQPPPWRAYPTWLNQAFAARLNLPKRWEEANSEPIPRHPIRPWAYESLTNPFWSSEFENCDPGFTFLPVEVRHPFFDVRLMSYLLAIPPMPWCVDKELLRVAMRGALPEQVRLRPKAPLAGEPLLLRLQDGDRQRVDQFEPAAQLARYVDRDAVPPVVGEEDLDAAWMNIRPLSLNHWLQDLAPVGPIAEQEDCHDGRGAPDQRSAARQKGLSQPPAGCLR